MYENISEKIQKVAKIIAILNIIGGFILFILGCIAISYAGAAAPYDNGVSNDDAGLVLIVIGIIVALNGVFTSWIIYGFGQMAADVSKLKNVVDTYTPVADQVADDLSAIRKIAGDISYKLTDANRSNNNQDPA
jgi:hypothetical protein